MWKKREQNLIRVFAKHITAQKEYLELNSFRCLILCHLIFLDTASISNGISKINFSQSQSRFGYMELYTWIEIFLYLLSINLE